MTTNLNNEIAKYGDFSEEDKEIIIEINDWVMTVDGTAEGWGGYSYDPIDYLETSIEIFKLTKKYFTNGHNDVLGG